MDDVKSHDYPQRQSQPPGGPELLLPVTSLDLLQQELDVTSNGLQVAKLNPLSGWRLWVTHLCLLLGLFMSSLEATIIATSLVTISAAFEDGQEANWIVAAYLITYTGFLIIFARLSDLFGRKPTLISAIVIFTSFSAACGAAQSMTQLIILRAFQGIGGAGLYSLGMSVIIEVTPFQYIGIATGLLGPTFASSSLLGPLLGGIITTRASWRWVFFVNVPVGLVILCVVAWIFPVNSEPLPIRRRTFSFVDYPGMLLSLLGVVTLIYAIEKGGARQAWSSPDIVATLATSAVAITGFVVWEWLVSNAKTSKIQMLPLFPIRLIQKRVLGSIFLTAFITGFPFMVTNIFLPQRFQLQNELRPIDAGLRMLPLLMMSAVGAGIGGAMVRYWNVSWHNRRRHHPDSHTGRPDRRRDLASRDIGAGRRQAGARSGPRAGGGGPGVAEDHGHARARAEGGGGARLRRGLQPAEPDRGGHVGRGVAGVLGGVEAASAEAL
ncbi:drug resistance transporter EmrB/QacA subfamily [Apiospora saccharicola]|uniref:Drug resistance transporter EmrB/QacA subfamily n=1 Tax=Apiospora saccharicola TaxID=335842 RepID=A0ABR1UNN0_9PEZI